MNEFPYLNLVRNLIYSVELSLLFVHQGHLGKIYKAKFQLKLSSTKSPLKIFVSVLK